MTGRDRTKALTKAFTGYLLKKKYSCAVELGILPWGRRKCDIVALNMKGEIIIVEVKQSIQDFRQDNKWTEYLGYCNKFYFGIPHDLFNKYEDEIRSKIKGSKSGLLVLDEDGLASVHKPAKRGKMIKGAKKNLIIRLAWRGGISARTNRRTRVYLD